MKNLNRWVRAIVGVIILLMAGLIYSWTVMSKTIGASRDWTASQLSVTFTIVMAFFCLGSLIGGILSKKIKPRIYILASGVFFFFGFLIASFTGDGPALLDIGFGVLCGLGAGFAYNGVMGSISPWFPDKQGLISGVLLMGFGFSSFIIGKVFAAVAPSDGTDTWQSVYLVMGIIIVILMVICSFFVARPGEDYVAPAAKNTKKVVREPASEMKTVQMLKQPTFWLFYVWAIMVSAAGLALVGQASGIASQVGTTVSDGTIATVVGLISIVNGVSRIIYGALYDKIGYKLTMLLDMVSFIVTAVILILALSTNSFVLIIIGFICGGFAYGGVTPMQSALISDFYGRTYYSTNFSVVVTNLMIGSFASTVAGNLYDASQSYMSTIYMMIIVTVVSFIVFLGIRRPGSSKKEKKAKEA